MVFAAVELITRRFECEQRVVAQVGGDGVLSLINDQHNRLPDLVRQRGQCLAQ